MKFELSKEIMEELTSNKYPTIFEFERAGQEKIQLVKYEDYLKLHSIIKEVREYIEKYDFITGYYDNNYDDVNDTYSHDNVKQELLEILDKVEE